MDSSDRPAAALSLKGVSASYGPRTVLNDLDLELRGGEIVAMFGHNGAGKTTAMRVAVGLKHQDRGTVHMNGRDLARMTCSARARRGIALVPEGVAGLFPTLSVRQNLAAVRSGAGRDPADVEARLHDAFAEVLVERAEQTAGSLSGGQRQMLAITLALMRQPAALLLDEPSTGLAPAVVKRLFALVAAIGRESGTAVLIVEQDVAAAQAVADRAVILQSGRLVASYDRTNWPEPTELWKFF